MTSRELIDWIKSEEAQGISDKKLKVSLKRRGWPEKDIDKAINLAHKKKVNWMPLLLLFIGSLIIFFLINSLDKSDAWVFIFLVGTVASLVYSLMVYIKSKQKEDFIELVLVNYTAGLFSLSVSFFTFNLLTMLIHLINLKVTVYLIVTSASFCIILLFYLFFFTIEKLSNHFMGYFDYESYFVFKHWPFKLFNVNWKKKWTLLMYPIIVIVISLAIAGVVFNVEVKHMGSSLSNTNSVLQEHTKQYMLEDCLIKLMDPENNSIIDSKIIPMLKNEDNYFYDHQDFSNIDFIKFDCNFEILTCQQKQFDPNRKLEEQVNFEEGENTVGKLITENKTIIYIIDDHPYQELLACSKNFNDEQRQLKIVKEFEDERKVIMKTGFEAEIPEVTWSNFFNVKYDVILNFIELDLKLGLLGEKTINYEIGPVYEIKQNITFYDNATTLERHITNLDENVEMLYSMYLSADKNKPKQNVGGFGRSMAISGIYSYKYIFSFGESIEYLEDQLFGFEELSTKIDEIRRIYNEDKIQELYNNKDVQESMESKAIRLKVLEILLAKKVKDNCEYYQAESWDDFLDYQKKCRNNVIEMTNTPELLH
jgi:hypothetical protein